MYHFTTRNLIYKSYRAKEFTIRMSFNGIDPQDILVKVFNTKTPKAEITVYVGSFSESRGVGYSNGKAVKITDPTIIELCRACLANDGAIAGLIDKLNERDSSSPLVAKLNRWWVLAQQESPSAFVDAERRQRAFDDKKFSIGDRVVYCSRYSGYRSEEATITGEQFDWHPYLGGGWRFSIPGINAPQTDLRPVEVAVPV